MFVVLLHLLSDLFFSKKINFKEICNILKADKEYLLHVKGSFEEKDEKCIRLVAKYKEKSEVNDFMINIMKIDKVNEVVEVKEG